jgi:hypothetical protein
MYINRPDLLISLVQRSYCCLVLKTPLTAVMLQGAAD